MSHQPEAYSAGNAAPRPADEALQSTCYALGLSALGRLLPGRDGAPGIDRHQLAERLQRWPIGRWPLGDLVLIARLEREQLGTDDVARYVADLVRSDRDDSTPPPRPQDEARAVLTAIAGVVSGLGQIPDVVRPRSEADAFTTLRAARDELVRRLDGLLHSYASALGIRRPWWARLSAAACACLVVAALVAGSDLARRPRRRAQRRDDATPTLDLDGIS